MVSSSPSHLVVISLPLLPGSKMAYAQLFYFVVWALCRALISCNLKSDPSTVNATEFDQFVLWDTCDLGVGLCPLGLTLMSLGLYFSSNSLFPYEFEIYVYALNLIIFSTLHIIKTIIIKKIENFRNQKSPLTFFVFIMPVRIEIGRKIILNFVF